MHEWRRFLQVDLARPLPRSAAFGQPVAVAVVAAEAGWAVPGLVWPACRGACSRCTRGLHSVPLPPSLLRWLAHLGLDAWSMCLLAFTMRQLGVQHRRLQRTMLGFVVLAGLLGAPRAVLARRGLSAVA